MDAAFKFIQHNRGLVFDVDYPSKGINGTCEVNETTMYGAKIKSYENVCTNENSLLKAVGNQTIFVAIDCGGDFRFYSSGVFEGNCSVNDFNHVVTVVGYGTSDEGTNYYVLACEEFMGY
ncbi:hypothetical protein IFM89_014051 [Coptis chinensis]|uniref:Peptidase C1A papain C-terminal domain-containing protein n=1 Tax=Coptis chinensis TaxID=261450 RepID=A0A835I001_9MAGN|nr:hypothetical protein IFM89_014051 [Coptis chinensis]